MLSYTETPTVEFFHPLCDRAGIRVLIRREELNHPFVSGNKWWKLKYNLMNLPAQTLLTFGGAYSNHIFATAAAAKELALKSIGIIRGERVEPLNHTLDFAERNGMALHFISRELYRQKNNPNFIDQLHEQFGEFMLIPEGGTNALALQGCKEFAHEKLNEIEFDTIMLAVGTGGTTAGIIAGLDDRREVVGVSVLKNGAFLKTDIANMLEKNFGKAYGNWDVLTSYDHGGYAKVTEKLLDFVSAMKEEHNLPLDTVYTGKLMWAVLKETERGRFPRGSTVLALHTGGLQGIYA
jgi:1-aminocyclopropane-1-carboxylate deaminase